MQDQLLQLHQLGQQLQDAGQQMPAQAQQLLQEHQQLLQSAQRSSTNTSVSSSSISAQSPPVPAPQQQQEPLQQEAQEPQFQQLSLQEQQQQLDWESIVDFPHGSLRLLGSCKSPWMDGDPEWVTEKAYSPVQCVDGMWMRQPLTLAAVMECSIQLQEGELRVFEQAGEFLEVVFQVGTGWTNCHNTCAALCSCLTNSVVSLRGDSRCSVGALLLLSCSCWAVLQRWHPAVATCQGSLVNTLRM